MAELFLQKVSHTRGRVFISGKNICKRRHLDMFFLINSKISNSGNRNVIRETWANEENMNKYSMDYVFVFGSFIRY